MSNPKKEPVKVRYSTVTVRDVKQGDLIITAYAKDDHPDINEAEYVLKAENIRPQGAAIQLYRTFTLRDHDKNERQETLGIDEFVLRFDKLKIKKQQEVVVVVKETVPIKNVLGKVLAWCILASFAFMVLAFTYGAAKIDAQRELQAKISASSTPVPLQESSKDRLDRKRR